MKTGFKTTDELLWWMTTDSLARLHHIIVGEIELTRYGEAKILIKKYKRLLKSIRGHAVVTLGKSEWKQRLKETGGAL